MASLDNSTVYVRTRAGLDVELTEAKEFDKIAGSRSERNTTRMKDKDMTFRAGKRDGGSTTISCFAKSDDPGQVELDVAFAEDVEDDRSTRLVTIHAEAGHAYQFTGVLLEWAEADSGAQDEEQMRTASFRVSGKPEKLVSFTPVTS